jgi:signal transduction histidine kinase
MLAEQQDGYRVAIADVSTRDALLRTQLAHDLVIFCGTMLVLLLIVAKLSRWVVRPVEEAWDRQRTFIADASHELKTPLSVILANTQILQADPSLTPESMRWVDGTAEEAQRMKELVSELLELARADESAATGSVVTTIREDCDLSKLVDGATLEFDAIAYERGCEIESIVEPGIHISCDRTLIERVVKILLDNGTKYAEQGSIVRATLSQEGHHVRFSVTNHGNVISPEDLEHVFDRFYRTDRARQREEYGGFGLGLAIAKGIVDAHGGQIHATSSEEEGTTFSIVL